jgi:hypothetical protein
MAAVGKIHLTFHPFLFKKMPTWKSRIHHVHPSRPAATAGPAISENRAAIQVEGSVIPAGLFASTRVAESGGL